MDVSNLIDRLRNNEGATAEEIEEVCQLSVDLLQKEDNVLLVQSPFSVCGDVHGDFENLLEIFDIFGLPPEGRYLFLGDYVDRGERSIEVMMLLLCLKLKYPRDMYLIRGNHESTHMAITFGFYNEVMNHYRDFTIWRAFVEVFKCMPLAAVIDSKLFCVHGGLCPSFTNVQQLEFINRFVEVPLDGIILDVLWSDPFDGLGFQTSPRQAGYRWGKDVSQKFTRDNNLEVIVRGHEQKPGGYEITHDDLVITVFSTPNYVKIFSEAAVLEVTSPTQREITRFRPKQWESLPTMLFAFPWLQGQSESGIAVANEVPAHEKAE
jgi:diadenosine tetraphosphatase ApaH/serine/threonine PP2A family protein phosphatase